MISEDSQTLDDIAKGSDNSTKKLSTEEAGRSQTESTADRSLPKATPRPKCDSCNVYLRKGVHSVNNTLFLRITAGRLFFFHLRDHSVIMKQ